jgi:hypothetical protein
MFSLVLLFCTEDAAMKKITRKMITDPEHLRRRELRLTAETVRRLSPEALAQAVSGCDTGSNVTQAPAKTVGC